MRPYEKAFVVLLGLSGTVAPACADPSPDAVVPATLPATAPRPAPEPAPAQTPPPTAPEAPPNPAPAQSPAPTQSPVVAKPPIPAPPLETLAANGAEGVLGKRVQGPAKEDMGLIVDVVVDHAGQPQAAVIDFGGFLGVGSRKIAVAWSLLQFHPDDLKAPIGVSLGRAEVQGAPEYNPAKPIQVIKPTPVPDARPPATPDAGK